MKAFHKENQPIGGPVKTVAEAQLSVYFKLKIGRFVEPAAALPIYTFLTYKKEDDSKGIKSHTF
ncbi:hypothetical protein ACFOU2_04395 [Bacillus songklensis]|uniref:Uncharacterized protein n=1 Tax=Bacillus songklensis TaxID=1069116 RepID=A0ABV8B0P2_9BACI